MDGIEPLAVSSSTRREMWAAAAVRSRKACLPDALRKADDGRVGSDRIKERRSDDEGRNEKSA